MEKRFKYEHKDVRSHHWTHVVNKINYCFACFKTSKSVKGKKQNIQIEVHIICVRKVVKGVIAHFYECLLFFSSDLLMPY